MRGVTKKTPERVAAAQRMREDGLLLREIAGRFGISVKTAHDWINDPDGRKLRARHESYSGECEVCGGPTTGCNGIDKAPTACMVCRTWTPEGMKAWVLDFFDEHGYPPRVKDSPWNGSNNAVGRIFGKWNTLLLECGLPLACDRRPETQRMVEERITRGDRVEDIAHDMGVTPMAVYQRMRYRGVRVRDMRAAE